MSSSNNNDRPTTRRIRSTIYSPDGSIIRDDKEDPPNVGLGSTIYSGDGKRVLWSNRKQYENKE